MNSLYQLAAEGKEELILVDGAATKTFLNRVVSILHPKSPLLNEEDVLCLNRKHQETSSSLLTFFGEYDKSEPYRRRYLSTATFIMELSHLLAFPCNLEEIDTFFIVVNFEPSSSVEKLHEYPDFLQKEQLSAVTMLATLKIQPSDRSTWTEYTLNFKTIKSQTASSTSHALLLHSDELSNDLKSFLLGQQTPSSIQRKNAYLKIELMSQENYSEFSLSFWNPRLKENLFLLLESSRHTFLKPAKLGK